MRKKNPFIPEGGEIERKKIADNKKMLLNLRHFLSVLFIMILSITQCYAFVYGGVSSFGQWSTKYVLSILFVFLFLLPEVHQGFEILVTTYEGPFFFFFS